MAENETSAREQGAREQQRVAVLPAPGMTTLYTNAFQTGMGRGEILLTACVTRSEKDQQGPVLVVQPQQGLAMSPETAKRLAATLGQMVHAYEQQFGEIKL